jgi:hypothetical protein
MEQFRNCRGARARVTVEQLTTLGTPKLRAAYICRASFDTLGNRRRTGLSAFQGWPLSRPMKPVSSCVCAGWHPAALRERRGISYTGWHYKARRRVYYIEGRQPAALRTWRSVSYAGGCMTARLLRGVNHLLRVVPQHARRDDVAVLRPGLLHVHLRKDFGGKYPCLGVSPRLSCSPSIQTSR